MHCVPKGHPGGSLENGSMFLTVLKDVLDGECGLPRVFSKVEELNVCDVI